MEFRILGPVEVVDEGKTLAIGGRQLALLALLLLHANEVVSADTLIDQLWPGQPPATAEKIVRNYVSLLRKQLGERLVRRAPGYVFRVEPGELDSERFETLVDEARTQQPAASAKTLRQALELWSGPPLAQLAYEPFAERAIADLEERRLEALEDRIDADLQLGRDRDLVPELERLVREEPLRERPTSLLMLALYRAGRQADALEAYQDARRRLVDELGLEPSPALNELQRQILAHDQALAGPRRARVAARRRRGGLMIVVGGAVLLAAGIAAGVLELTSSSAARLTSVAPSSVGVIDPKTNRIVAQVPLGSEPAAITYGDGAVWTANTSDRTVSRIDPESLRVARTIAVPGNPLSLVVLGRNLWVLLEYSQNGTGDAATGDAGVAQVDAGANDVFGAFHLPAQISSGFDTIASDGTSLWSADHGIVSRLDPATGRVTAKLTLENWFAPGLAFGFGSVWALDSDTVARIDPESQAISASIPITGGTGPGPTPTAVAVGDGAVWVANRMLQPANGSRPSLAWKGTVSRIDPATDAVTATIPVGRYSVAISVGDGAVWVANRDDGTVSKIDPKTNRVVTSLSVGGQPEGVTVGAGRVWVTVD